MAEPPGDIGSAAAQALAAGGPGRVIATFARACYVVLDRTESVFAIVDERAPSGPVHLRAREVPVAAVGDPVRVTPGGLLVGRRFIEIPARRWRPRPVDLRGHHAAALATLGQVLGHLPEITIGGSRVDVAARLRDRGVAATMRELAGRGGGLTPAGDDVVAGMLLVTRLREAWPQERLEAQARAQQTHPIAGAFLRAAAQGETIEPVHDLLFACCDGDASSAAGHRGVLARVGHTSGLDLAYGAWVGLACADVIDGESAADARRDCSSAPDHSTT